MNRRTLGTFLLVLAIIVLIIIAYRNNQKREETIVFTQRAILASTWNTYKRDYLEGTTYRTLDRQRDNITTSEGQSYTMLRSVWMDDKDIFDKSWQWTKDNLRRKDDQLFSWLFGKKPNGTYGVLTTQGGSNSASDADTDIAVALLFAAARWNSESYRNEARAIIEDIWEHEVVMIKGKPYLAANNIEKTSDTDYIIVNPSYLAPYAYRMFAEIDPTHPWLTLIDSSYEVLDKSMSLPLDKKKSAGLPPNWIVIDRRSGEIKPSPAPNLETHYGYDAIRVPWRLALDWEWYQEERAKNILKEMSLLANEWQKKKLIYTVYSHDGKEVQKEESPAHYGTSLGYFMIHNPQGARDIYEKKLALLYSNDHQTWKRPLSYYDDNWAWFGLALYANQLPNLYAYITND